MYYSNVPVNGSLSHAIPVATTDKPGGVFMPAPAHYPTASAYPAAAQLPVAVPPQRLSTPQAYAIATNPYGGMSPTSYSTLQAVPQANAGHAYLATTGQYPSSYGFATVGPRSVTPAAYPGSATPIQAGAPLFAAGYSGIPSGTIAAQQAAARPVPMGYQPAYTLATEIPFGAATYGTRYQ